jgi:hypothetical protein
LNFHLGQSLGTLSIDKKCNDFLCLYKNRNYKLRVQAWSLGGEGKYSSPEKEFRFGKNLF